MLLVLMPLRLGELARPLIVSRPSVEGEVPLRRSAALQLGLFEDDTPLGGSSATVDFTFVCSVSTEADCDDLGLLGRAQPYARLIFDDGQAAELDLPGGLDNCLASNPGSFTKIFPPGQTTSNPVVQIKERDHCPFDEDDHVFTFTHDDLNLEGDFRAETRRPGRSSAHVGSDKRIGSGTGGIERSNRLRSNLRAARSLPALLMIGHCWLGIGREHRGRPIAGANRAEPAVPRRRLRARRHLAEPGWCR